VLVEICFLQSLRLKTVRQLKKRIIFNAFVHFDIPTDVKINTNTIKILISTNNDNKISYKNDDDVRARSIYEYSKNLLVSRLHARNASVESRRGSGIIIIVVVITDTVFTAFQSWFTKKIITVCREMFISVIIQGTYIRFPIKWRKNIITVVRTVIMCMYIYGAYRAVASWICTRTQIKHTHIHNVHIYDASSESLVNNKILFPFSEDKKKIIFIIFVRLQLCAVRQFLMVVVKNNDCAPREIKRIYTAMLTKKENGKKIIIITFDCIVVCVHKCAGVYAYDWQRGMWTIFGGCQNGSWLDIVNTVTSDRGENFRKHLSLR